MTYFRTASLACLLLTGLLPAILAAQGLAMDTLPLSKGRYAEASMLLEKTLFRIDVARLSLRFGPETALALGKLVDGRRHSDALADTVVLLAIQTRDAWASLGFRRDVDFGRFLEGIRDGISVARKAGLLDPGFARGLSDSLPTWYASLRTRGVKDGDVMMYRITGDTLRTVFRTVEGRILVDQEDVGPQPRLSVMGGFLAPGSDFRKGLLISIFANLEDSAPSPRPSGPTVSARERPAEGIRAEGQRQNQGGRPQ